MTQYNRNTLIISIAILLITSFNRGAVKYAPIIQKDTTGLVCGLRYTEPIRCELQYTQSVQNTFNPMNQ
jgi:hypothetical protein